MSPKNHDINTQDLLKKLMMQARKELTMHLNFLFGKVDDALFSIADKTRDANTQTLHFDSMKALRLERGSILHHFFRELENPDALNALTQAAATEDDEFAPSLINQEEMEEHVAVNNIISHGLDMFSQEITAFKTRLEWLNEHYPGAIPQELFSLKALVNSFRKALHYAGYDPEVNLLILKLFEQHTLVQLGSFYHNLNEILIEAGIMPKIRNRRRSQEGEESPKTDAASLASILSKVFGGESSGGNTSISRGGIRTTVSFSEMGAPSGIIVPPDVEWTPDTLRSQVLEIFRQQSGGRRQVSQLERQILELVSVQFAAMLADRRIQEPIRTLIARLQWPILKTALEDTSFFRNTNHPARDLMNRYALLGSQQIIEGSGTYKELVRITDMVVNQFQTNPSVFKEAIAKLKQIEQDSFGQLARHEQTQAEERRRRLVERARERVK